MNDEAANGEVMKSALELALEKTAHIEPKGDPLALTDEEKVRVREINMKYDQKISELEMEVSRRLREVAETSGQQELQQHLAYFQQQITTARDGINAERQEELNAYLASIGKARPAEE